MRSGLVRDATFTVGARVLSILFSLGTASATAWFLGPDGRGQLAICLIMAQLLVLGLGFGVEMGCAYQAGRDRTQLGTVLGTQLVTFAITAVLITLVGVACLSSSLPFVKKVSGSALTYGITFAVVQIVFVYLTVLFMGMGRLTAYNLARIGNQGVVLLVVLIACSTTRSVSVAVLGYVSGSVFGAVFLMGALAQTRPLPRIRVSWRSLTACYKYGIRYYFGKLATLADVQMGVIVITLVGTTPEVGLFATAMGLVTKLWILPEALNIVLLSRVLQDQSAAGEMVLRSCRMATITAFGGGLVVAIFAKPIVAVMFSSAFLPIVFPLLVLLPGVVAGCTFKVLVSYFNGTGVPEYSSLTLFVGLATNIGLVLVLLPRWDLLGAAVAASAAYTVEAILAAYLFVRLTGYSWRSFIPCKDDLRVILSLIRRRPTSQTPTHGGMSR